MIIDPNSLQRIKRHYDEFHKAFDKAMHNGTLSNKEVNLSLYLWKIDFFHENPHLLFPAGFDEVRYVYGRSALKSILADPLL